MSIPIQNFTGNAPNTKECRTEYIVHDFSRCLSNNAQCKYSIPAGFTSTYCLHPDHRTFQVSAAPNPVLDTLTYGTAENMNRKQPVKGCHSSTRKS